jgi:hypothetical protein
MTARRPLVLITGRQQELPSADSLTGAEPAIAAGVAGQFWQGDKTWTYPHFTPGGRLTLESGVAVSTSDQTAKGTLYYTPSLHDGVRVLIGSNIVQRTFAELSLALTLTSGKNYDVFVYDNSGTLTLELSAAWTNDTTQADALAWQAGLGWVKSASSPRLWLGTIRASGTNTCEDSLANRFVWNAYNQVPRRGLYVSGNDAHTYTTAARRDYNNNAATYSIKFVAGRAGDAFPAVAANYCKTSLASTYGRLSVQFAGANVYNASEQSFNNTTEMALSGCAILQATKGLNTVTACEYANAATVTYNWLEINTLLTM